MTEAPKHGDGGRPVDPVTGYETTGHNWNGILELNTPMSKIAVGALALAFAYSVVAWILLPAWPVGQHATRGLLGLTQGGEAEAGLVRIEDGRRGWVDRFDGKPDFAALAADKALMAEAMPAAARLFSDNCAACHGASGGGGPGFPVLSDNYWLWGGDPATVAETIRVGINSTDNDTRFAQMPNFTSLSAADLATLVPFVASLRGGRFDPAGKGGQLFTENCASCHNDAAQGGMQNGAPSLTDMSVIYGQDEATVEWTLSHGRQGAMPTWAGRLSPAQINLLALYVSRLSQKANVP